MDNQCLGAVETKDGLERPHSHQNQEEKILLYEDQGLSPQQYKEQFGTGNGS